MLKRTWLCFVPIAVLGTVVPFVVRVTVGLTPGNDEWSYAKAALALHAGHGIQLQGFNQMFLIGQLVGAQPLLAVLGARLTSLAVFGVVAGVVWLAAVLALVRPELGDRRALLLVLVLAVSPLLALLTPSFMTDVPASAGAVLALLLSVQAVERGSAGRLLVAVLVTLAAFTIREQAIVVLVVLAVAVAVRWRNSAARFRGVAVASIAACVLVGLVIEHLRHRVPHGDPPPFGLGSVIVSAVPDDLARGWFTVALVLSPLALVVLRRAGRPSRRVVLCVAGVTVAVAVLLVALGPEPSVLLDNYIDRRGAYANALVGSPAPLFGVVAWTVVQLVAVLSAIVLGVEALVRGRAALRSPHSLRAVPVRLLMIYLHALLLAVLSLGLALIGEHQYDRYVLSLLPAMGVFVLSRRASPDDRPSRASLAPPIVGCAVMLAFSLFLMIATYTRDDAVWQAADRLTRDGVPATSINAGSAWDGWHASTPLERLGDPLDDTQYPGDLWARRFPRSSDCWVVSLSRLPGPDWRLTRVVEARPFGIGIGLSSVYTYRRVAGRPLGSGTCARPPAR